MKVEIEPRQLVERKADDRGRVTLGSEFAGETVRLLILEDEGDE